MSSIGPNDLAFVDGYLYRVMVDMLRAEGADAAGLYNYYEVRVDKDRHSLSGYDRLLFNYILQSFDRDSRRIVHAGIGLGTLTCLLAGGGYRVAGIEQDPVRFRGAERLRAALIQAWPEAAERYELIAGQYPAAVAETSWLSSSTLLIFTNCGAGWSDELTTSIIESFPRGGDVIFDARLFGRVRDSAAERQELIERVAGRGFGVQAIEHTPAQGHFFHARSPR